MMRRLLLALGASLVWITSALAQSSPGLVQGQVPTAAQWNSYFAAKQDYLGFTPLNPSSVVGTPPITVSGGAGVLTIACPTCLVTSTGIIVGTTVITSGTDKGLLYDNAGVLGNLATGNNGVLITSGAGVPSISSTLPNAVQDNITRLGTISVATTFSVQINAALLYGGSATNSTATIQSTSNGSPSGDSANILATTINLRTISGLGTATVNFGVSGGAAGVLNIAGSSSGVISVKGTSGTYNFNLPTGAGTAGQALLSGGGGSNAQTYGTLGVAAGGTGQVTLTNHGVLIGAGTNAITQLAAANTGTLLAGVTGADPAFTAAPSLGANGGTGGSLKLFGATSGDGTIQVAAAAGTATIFQLPASNGVSGQFLQTNGSGVTSWQTAAGTGTVTTISQDANTSVILSTNPCTITCTVSAGSGNRKLLNTLTASNSASLADTTSLTSTYDTYEIEFDNILPATTNQPCRFRVNSGGVQTTSYLALSFESYGNNSNANVVPTTYISCLSTTANAGTGISGIIRVNNPSQTSAPKNFYGMLAGFGNSVVVNATTSGYWNGGNGAVTGFQVDFASGNIASGVIKVYGIVK